MKFGGLRIFWHTTSCSTSFFDTRCHCVLHKLESTLLPPPPTVCDFANFALISLKPNQLILFYYFIKLFWYVQEWAWIRVKILKCKINSTFITLRAKLQKSDIVLLFSQGSYSSSIMFEPIYTFFRNQSSWQPTQCTWDTVGR